MISRHHRNRQRTMAALILTRYPGWIRTAVIISPPAHSWSHRTSIISKGESPGAPISLAWALTIEATELHLAHPPPTTDLWRENTSRHALRRREHSLIYDSHYFGSRLLLKIRFTIFILQLRLRACIGSFQFLREALSLALTGAPQRSRWKMLRWLINRSGPPLMPSAHQP